MNPDPVELKVSIYGFPVGKVAEAMRKILTPSFTRHHVESISAVLVIHLMIEEQINILINKWMLKGLPSFKGKIKGQPVDDYARFELKNNINRLDFSKKLDMIKPLGTLLWADESDGIFKDVRKINNVRVEIAHRLDFEKIKFRNKAISTEAGLDAFLDLAHQRLQNLIDLAEIFDI